MYEIKPSTRFKKNVKAYKYNTIVLEELKSVLNTLQTGNKLPIKYVDHGLSGNLSEYRECHVLPDVLLMYQIEDNDLLFARIWSHSDIFKK